MTARRRGAAGVTRGRGAVCLGAADMAVGAKVGAGGWVGGVKEVKEVGGGVEVKEVKEVGGGVEVKEVKEVKEVGGGVARGARGRRRIHRATPRPARAASATRASAAMARACMASRPSDRTAHFYRGRVACVVRESGQSPFHRLSQMRQRAKVVMGSSADLICLW